MNRHEYVQHLADFGRALTSRPTADALARQAYIDRLVTFGRSLLHGEEGADQDLAEFRRHIMNNPREILWRVAGATALRRRALSPSGRAMLSVLELWPDLLGPLQQHEDEVAHSTLMAHFLSPLQSGEIGSACIKAFVDLLLTPTDEEPTALPDRFDMRDLKVQAERHLGKYGRVDISIESMNTIVFIEVKVGASEGRQQLSGYAKALEALSAASARQPLLVFLTARADQAPSIKLAARHVTFRQLLSAWLPISVSGRTPEHLYLSLYLKTIACHFYNLADADAFDCWPLATQRRAMQFLETEVAFT